MIDEKELSRFTAWLSNEIGEESLGDTDGAHFRETSFVRLAANTLEEFGIIEGPVACFHRMPFGNAFLRINGYAVPDEAERIDLLAAIYLDSEQPRPVSTEELARTSNQALRAIKGALRSIHKQMEEASDRYAMMQRIAEVLATGIKEARVLIFTDGLITSANLDPVSVSDVRVRFEIYDLRRLMRLMTSGQTHEVIEIDLALRGLEPIPCVAMPSHGERYEAYLAIVPGETLFKLYDEFGPRLLEYNVRAFLQATTKVNRGMRETLRLEPHYFMAYNNGISATVDELTINFIPGKGTFITHLRGLQIVNGGQTTASIHRARKRDRHDISSVYVAAKITRLPAEQVESMVPRISRYANTQNVIQEADFSSNESFHIVLEHLSKSIWCPGERTRWFYERARGQYQTAMGVEGSTPARLRGFRDHSPKKLKFTKTDLAKFLNSWECLPHVVSSGSQKNFVAFMRSLRHNYGPSWEPDEQYYRHMIAKAILFQAATEIVRREGFPAYRANIVCYLVAYLSHRTGARCDFDAVWKNQAISTELRYLLAKWSRSVAKAITESAGARNITEWCKKEECWDTVKALNLPLPSTLPPEFVVHEQDATSSD